MQPSYGVFAQDSFKWKPNFTINIGRRYEWDSTPSEAMGRFKNFDLTMGTLIPAGHPFHTNNNNFQPRIGFAASNNWAGHRLLNNRTVSSIEDLAKMLNPKLRGWFNDYGRFNASALRPIERHVGPSLVRWTWFAVEC